MSAEAGYAWYVMQCKPHKEGQVNAYLTGHGIETFYPTVKVKPVNPRCSTIQPYFPRYLFVHVDLHDVSLGVLQWSPGVIGLVQFDAQPAIVAEKVIQHLKQHVGNLEVANPDLLKGVKRGDPLKIKHGPLAGYEAIFDIRLSGSERVQVLLHLLGRTVRATVNANAIERQLRSIS